jgi:hypothetical protein
MSILPPSTIKLVARSNELKAAIRKYKADEIRDLRKIETSSLTIRENNACVRAHANWDVKNLLPD